jgi:hypothetical protein
MMSYPTSCFWKVVRGSAESYGDLNEWPQGNYGEYVFEMLFVGYLVLISAFLSAGVAKLHQTVLSNETPEVYWQWSEGKQAVSDALKLPLPGFGQQPTVEEEEKPSSPTLRPGAGWRTAFVAFLVIFPLVVVSCLAPSTPIFIPWSSRVWLSLVKNFTAWLVALVMSGGILSAAALIIVLGASYAPFWTFTLCSPLAALGMLVYGRLLGRLSWLISHSR